MPPCTPAGSSFEARRYRVWLSTLRPGVLAEAGASEVLVTRTVKDLLAGSGPTFVARGSRELKGVPDVWELYAVEG